MLTGAQLYTVRAYTQTKADFRRTIDKVARMGYRTVQLSAIGRDLRPEWVKKVCDDAGLAIVLTHADTGRILYDTERVIEEHVILDCPYIGIGSMPDKYRTPEWLSYFAEDFKEPAEKIALAGKLLMYHNHDFEFRKFKAEHVKGATENTYVMDYLMEWFGPSRMGVTLDTYWVQAAGADVCQWIRRLKDRVHCVHLKDMEMTKDGAVMAPVGQGNMNFPAIIRELDDTCCRYLLVEQDVCRTSPFDCLKTSYDNLVSMGLQ